MMTHPRKQPSREQTRAAFEWLARWHTTGPHPGEEDLNTSALQILGADAYRVIVTTARDWRPCNTTANGARRSTSWLDIATNNAHHVPVDHSAGDSTCAYYDTAESAA